MTNGPLSGTVTVSGPATGIRSRVATGLVPYIPLELTLRTVPSGNRRIANRSPPSEH